MIHSQQELDEMLEDIEQRGERLSDWETRFLDDMMRQTGNFTSNEAKVIDRIHGQKVPV